MSTNRLVWLWILAPATFVYLSNGCGGEAEVDPTNQTTSTSSSSSSGSSGQGGQGGGSSSGSSSSSSSSSTGQGGAGGGKTAVNIACDEICPVVAACEGAMEPTAMCIDGCNGDLKNCSQEKLDEVLACMATHLDNGCNKGAFWGCLGSVANSC